MQNINSPVSHKPDLSSGMEIDFINKWDTTKIITMVAMATIAAVAVVVAACMAASIFGAPILIAVPIALKIGAFILTAVISALACTVLGLNFNTDGANIRLAREQQEEITAEKKALEAECANLTLLLKSTKEKLQNCQEEQGKRIQEFERQLTEKKALEAEHANLTLLLNSTKEKQQKSQEEQGKRIQELERQLAKTAKDMQAQKQTFDGSLQAMDRLVDQLEAHVADLQKQLNTKVQALGIASSRIANLEKQQEELVKNTADLQQQLKDTEAASQALLAAVKQPPDDASSLFASSIRASSLSASWVDMGDQLNLLEQSILLGASERPISAEVKMLDAALQELERKQACEIKPKGNEETKLTWLLNALSSLKKAGGHLLSALGTTIYEASAIAKIAAIIDANTEHNHPWKQEKYETAIKRLKAQFISKCTADDAKNLQTPLGLEVSRLLANLIAAATYSDIDYRGAYYEVIITLRLIINSAEYQELIQKPKHKHSAEEAAIVGFVRNLCQVRYMDVEMYDFCEQLINDVLAAGKYPTPNQTDITLAQFEAIKNAPAQWKGVELSKQIGKLKGHTNINFDPALYCNVPFVLGDMPITPAEGQTKKVRLLRMGVPTIQSLGTWNEMLNKWKCISTGLDPIWKECMAAQAEQGKVHLYVSFQNDIPKAGVNGDESMRNAALKELAKENAGFKFVVLAQDSAFYRQENAEEVKADTFKAQFVEQMLGDAQKTGFYFPEEWKNDGQFKQDLETMLDGLHQALYPQAHSLTQKQRQNFIEIFEACLFLHLLVKSGADTANGTCKDAIDRAMKTLTLVQQIAMMGQGNANDEELKRIQRTYAHAPAFMVKKQAMIKDRRDRLLAAMEELASPEVQVSMQVWLQSNQKLFGLIQTTAEQNTCFQIERQAQ